MIKLRGIGLLPFIAVAAFLTVCTPVFADTYIYMGQPFTIFQGVDLCSAGIGECALSGQFTTSTGLAANLALTSITPTSFSFTDGNTTITNLTANPSGLVFEVGTDASGNIDDWFITFNDAPTPQISGHQYLGFCTSSIQSAQRCAPNSFDSTIVGVSFIGGNPGAATSDSAGNWTETPEPCSALLLGTGLVAALGKLKSRHATP